MKFDLNLITDLPVLEQVEIDGVRHYTSEDGSIEKPYPSVTTVLSADEGKQKSLAKWRARVGEEEADRISLRATTRGTAVHEVLEDYILGQEPRTKHMPHIYAMADDLKRLADKHISNIRMVEGQLFSHHLRVAGTVDLVADFDGKPAIIDWKTSNYHKKKDHVTSYFMQESAYAVMFEERTGIPVQQLVTLIACNDGAQMFVEDRDEWIGQFVGMRNKYEYDNGRTHGPM